VTLNPNETFQINANKQVTFSSDDSSVATVDSSGLITTHAPGSCSITASDGEDTTSCLVTCGNVYRSNSIDVTITQPTVNPMIYGELNNYTYVGTNDNAKAYIYCPDPHVTINDGVVQASKIVDTTLTIYTEGLVLHTRLVMSSPKVASLENTVLKKGMAKKFVTGGVPAVLLSQMKNKSNRYLNFSSNTIKAKKTTGKINVTLNDGVNTSSLDFWSVDQKTYNIIKSAYAIARTKPHYSQKKRRQKKYVDCSTFAWRTYKKAGLTLGNKKYAPTAAEDAKWLKKHALLMKGTAKNMKKLRPGDLLFFSGGSNHRFMNINHVAVYVSNDCIIGTVDGYSPTMGCIGESNVYYATAIGRLHSVKYRK
jgi:hypothetical protein